MRNRVYVILFYSALIVFVMVNKEAIVAALPSGELKVVPVVMLSASLLALIPVVPFGIVAGIIGAAYGPVWGSVIAVVSSTVAAVLTFISLPLLFQYKKPMNRMGNKRIERYYALLERNAFLAVFLARSVPIIPAVVVTVGAFMIRMSFVRFVIATLLGKIPAMLLFVVLGYSV